MDEEEEEKLEYEDELANKYSSCFQAVMCPLSLRPKEPNTEVEKYLQCRPVPSTTVEELA